MNIFLCWCGVTIVLCLGLLRTKSMPFHLHPPCNTKFGILINSTFFVNLLPYVWEYRNNILCVSCIVICIE